MTVSINVDVGRKDAALVVPADVIRDPTGEPWVLAIVGGRAERRAVTLGMRGDGLVEVTAGLVAGRRRGGAGRRVRGGRRAGPGPAGAGAGGPAMPFELFVALRFLREGRAQTALILGGTTVGVAVIIFLSALIGGLQATLIDQTLSSQAHVILQAARPGGAGGGAAGRRGGGGAAWRRRRSARSRSSSGRRCSARSAPRPGVMAATPTAAGSAFAARGELSRSVALRGLDRQTFDPVIKHRPAHHGRAASASRGPRRSSATVLAHDLGRRGGRQAPASPRRRGAATSSPSAASSTSATRT